MNTDASYLLKRISEGEHQQQDFKFEISDARKIAKSISAFANTHGGRLLVGVKDNGKIAGIQSEEELYMIQAAADLYSKPSVTLQSRIIRIDGKDVLEVEIPEHHLKPVYAVDENNRLLAYVRINDENILADVIQLNVWKRSQNLKNTLITYSSEERKILDALHSPEAITLKQCVKQTSVSRNKASVIIADFIRFGLVERIFSEHKFYFRLKADE